MKALVQRVEQASVRVGDAEVARTGPGLLVFLGVGHKDTAADAQYLAHKVLNLRIFSDEYSRFSLSPLDTRAEILIVSQFTLMADTRKGRRPSFTDAAEPDKANGLYGFFVEQVRSSGLRVETGVFQEHMVVDIRNDGPVTLLLESK